jgi:hypothetical protein
LLFSTQTKRSLSFGLVVSVMVDDGWVVCWLVVVLVWRFGVVGRFLLVGGGGPVWSLSWRGVEEEWAWVGVRLRRERERRWHKKKIERG